MANNKLREALENCAKMGEQIDCQLGSSDETVYAFRDERSLAYNISECARAALAEKEDAEDGSCIIQWEDMPYEEVKSTSKKDKRDKVVEPKTPPPLARCPKCGKDAAQFRHPTFDTGTYVSCNNCHYSPQAKTWAATDAMAAVRWNNMVAGDKKGEKQ